MTALFCRVILNSEVPKNKERKEKKYRKMKQKTKKRLVMLLCLNLVLSMAACREKAPIDSQYNESDQGGGYIEDSGGSSDEGSNGSQNGENNFSPDEGEDESQEEEFEPIILAWHRYYQIEKISRNLIHYSVFDARGKTVLEGVTESPLQISMVGEDLVDICVGNELSVHKYYDVKTNSFSPEYSHVVACSGNLVAYLENPLGDSHDRRLVVCDIFDGKGYYRRFTLNDFSNRSRNSILHAEFTEGENELEIRYLASRDGLYPTNVSLTLPIRYQYSFDDYESIIQLYRRILVSQNSYCLSSPDIYGLYSIIERDWCNRISESALLFSLNRTEDTLTIKHSERSWGYAIKDLNRDGIDELVLLNEDYTVVALFSMANGKPVLLDSYEPYRNCWIDETGALHVLDSAGVEGWTNTVQRITDGGEQLELIAKFGSDGYQWNGSEYVPTYYQTVNGQNVRITEEQCHALEEQYGVFWESQGAQATKEFSGLCFIPAFSENDIAMNLYKKVLMDEIKVYDTKTRQYLFLRDYRMPSNQSPLSETTSPNFAYLDLDGEKLLVINSIDTLVLRCYEDTVYLYSFDSRQMGWPLRTDGSYYRGEAGTGFYYGYDRLCFEGEELKPKELWRGYMNGENEYAYYVEGVQVTKDAFLAYASETYKHPVLEYQPLKVFWWLSLPAREAKEKADAYWGFIDGGHDAAAGTSYFSRVVVVDSTRNISGYYRVILRGDSYSHAIENWESFPPRRIEYLEEILVDPVTGHCVRVEPTYNDGK